MVSLQTSLERIIFLIYPFSINYMICMHFTPLKSQCYLTKKLHIFPCPSKLFHFAYGAPKILPLSICYQIYKFRPLDSSRLIKKSLLFMFKMHHHNDISWSGGNRWRIKMYRWMQYLTQVLWIATDATYNKVNVPNAEKKKKKSPCSFGRCIISTM